MLIFLFLFTTHLSEAQICRSIALEGGGSHGSYEVGAIWALVNLSNPEDVTWDAVSGISIGSINAGSIVQFPVGQELAMSNYLMNFWQSMNGSNSIYVDWQGGELDGLLFHSGIFDTSPLEVYLRTNFKYGIHRKFSIGASNLDTGIFSTFNESVGGAIINAMMCSSAPPPFFPIQSFEGYTWIDGGCIVNLDAFSAVERCLEITAEKNIVTDIIFDFYYSNLAPETKFKTLDVFERSFSIRGYDSSVWFVYSAMAAYPLVDFRYVIVPSDPRVQELSWRNFSKPVIDFQIQLGINDTKAILKSGKTGRTIISELYEENKRKIIYP